MWFNAFRALSVLACMAPGLWLGFEWSAGELGIDPLGTEVHAVVAAWPWQTYLGEGALDQERQQRGGHGAFEDRRHVVAADADQDGLAEAPRADQRADDGARHAGRTKCNVDGRRQAHGVIARRAGRGRHRPDGLGVSRRATAGRAPARARSPPPYRD